MDISLPPAHGSSAQHMEAPHMETPNHSVDPWKALAVAVTTDDVAAASRLLSQHPELKARLNEPMPEGVFGATPLLSAVSRKNKKMIDVLLQSGADINARSHWWAGGFGVLD